MKIFLTGATGFLGQHLLRRLQREHHEVTCLVRDSAVADRMAEGSCRVVEGSLENVGAWSKWLRGHDVVIHAAAPIEFHRDWSFFESQIVAATEKLYRAASREGVRRFIYISSESVVQGTRSLLGVDETVPYCEPSSMYGRAKQLAEQALLQGVSETECIIIRPTFMWGKGMPELDKIIRRIDSGSFRWVDQGKTVIDWVHVENVVEAIVCALQHGQDKSIYYVTDDNAKPLREIFTSLLAARNVTAPAKNSSSFSVRLAARITEFWWRLLGRKTAPPISLFDWSFVAVPRQYDISKARAELHYHPVISEKMGLAEMRRQAS